VHHKGNGLPQSRPGSSRAGVPKDLSKGDATSHRRKRRVLVVEDHPDTRAAVAEHLADRGFDVTIACDGEAAMLSIRQERPDLVYLDMNLPQISGYDVCEQIRTDPLLDGVGVVMTSAQASIQVHVSCLEAGADAFIPKPFELDVVADVIDRIVAAREASSGQASKK
jgi:two-component system, OmpR family, phosphate regulon response regulator PhoB